MRLIDSNALLEKAIPKNDQAQFRCVPIEDIINAPTIEERKTGEWINITNDESLEEEYECSVCGYELFYSNPTNYCPSCGARMHELETESRDYENKGDDD